MWRQKKKKLNRLFQKIHHYKRAIFGTIVHHELVYYLLLFFCRSKRCAINCAADKLTSHPYDENQKANILVKSGWILALIWSKLNQSCQPLTMTQNNLIAQISGNWRRDLYVIWKITDVYSTSTILYISIFFFFARLMVYPLWTTKAHHIDNIRFYTRIRELL